MDLTPTISGATVNRYRTQEYGHERSLGGESYFSTYRHKETTGVEDISELYHENTKLSELLSERLATTASSLAGTLEGILPRIDPDYPDRERVELPSASLPTMSLDEVLELRRSATAFGPGSMDEAELSSCLSAAVGRRVSGRRSRTYPSPGALYPTEVFPVVIDVDGIEPGLYHYNHDGHFLRRLRPFTDAESGVARLRECLYEEGIEPDLDDACCLFALGADFWRAKFKYGPRGYRYTLQESGHVAQNVLLALTATGLAGRPLAAFRDGPTNDFLGLDGVNEAVVYLVAAGRQPPAEGGE